MKNKIYIIILLASCLFPLQIGLVKEDMDIESFIDADLKNELSPNLDRSAYRDNILKEKIRNADPQKLLAFLSNYDKNISYLAQQKVLLYEVEIANLHPSSEIRQEVTHLLITSFFDPNSKMSRNAYEFLLSFTKDDFSANTKKILHNALSKKEPSGWVIKICGVANMQEELPRLNELTMDEIGYINSKDFIKIATPFYLTTGWAARLARARMGVKEDIIKCIKISESVKDPNERVLQLLPDIGYIRRPEAIEYLKEYLDGNGRLAPLDPGRPGIPVSSYALDILAKSLKNFPDVWNGGKDIEFYRKWMSEQKEWQIIR